VAGLLIKGSGESLFGGNGDDDPTDTTVQEPQAEGVPVARVVDFDPKGGDGEHSNEVGNAVDGDPETTWSSESYDSPDWGGLKDGVGLIFELDDPSQLGALEFDTPSTGWQAEVYVAERAGDTLADWGPPVATFDQSGDGTARTTFDADGGAVLLWFTRAGDNGKIVVEDVRLER
jgi:hypothetical protein